jgi:nitrogen fixation/metabolism regulation signal transduction histidine kinase
MSRRATLWRRWLLTILPVAAGLVALLASVLLVADLSVESQRLAAAVPALLVLCLVALVLLLVALVDRLLMLLSRRRRNEPGARLRLRLTLLFTVLSLPPAAVIYAFSLQFLHQTIDSWFDAELDVAMNDAVAIGQQFLEQRREAAIRDTARAAEGLAGQSGPVLIVELGRQRQRLGAEELAVFDGRGQLVAARFADALRSVPVYPDQASLIQARSRRVFASTEPSAGGLVVRVVVRLEEAQALPRVLQARFALDPALVGRLQRIEREYSAYQQLDYLRGPFKLSLSLVLSMVLLFTLLLATLAALTVSRRLVAPLGELAQATSGVGRGDYRQLPLPENDEVGFLVRAFNRMNRELAQADAQTRQSQIALESEKAYLQAVLSRLSSGVLIIDRERCLRAANEAAEQVLAVELGQHSQRPLQSLLTVYPELVPLITLLLAEMDGEHQDWRQELALLINGRQRLLLLRGTSFTVSETGQPVYVVVFDDITVLIEAQRQAAWGEVARRLAHEVKNPLTPIQLASERLRRKLMGSLDEEQSNLLQRATGTIIGQVESLKAMVDAFSDYARPPRLSSTPLRLKRLLQEVADLYQTAEARLQIHLDIEPDDLSLRADRERLRQVFNNLFGNAMDATREEPSPQLYVQAKLERIQKRDWVVLHLRDNGPGFAAHILGRVFEPYVTSKPGGTGLGLAIVRKIIEEHGGTLVAENATQGGARVILRLPLEPSIQVRKLQEQR